MIALDYIGVATIITSLCAGVAAMIVAWRQPKIGRQVEEVHTAVSTPPGAPTIGEAVITGAETLDHVHDIVCNGKPEPPH